MPACLSEFLPWYSFAEVNSVTVHRFERPAPGEDAVSAAWLLHEALVLKLAEIEQQIDSCRQRIDAIEAQFGLTPPELDAALAEGRLAVSMGEAESWRDELELLELLSEKRRRIVAMVGS